jgi:hypothetical protein
MNREKKITSNSDVTVNKAPCLKTQIPLYFRLQVNPYYSNKFNFGEKHPHFSQMFVNIRKNREKLENY